MVVLSKRLQALADMVTAGNRVADVGCDHGFVSIYLVQKKIAPYVYAMDVREGPLQRAKEHIKTYGMENYIETRLSDGMTALLPGEAQSLVCAGMGGKLMQKILTDSREKAQVMQELILQPQSEISAFRRFLRQEGYEITEEKMILEEGKYYPIMKAVPKGKRNAEMQCEAEEKQQIWDKFGRLLLEQKDPVLVQYLHFNLKIQKEVLEKLQSSNEGNEAARKVRQDRIEEVLTEIEDMQQALSEMEAGNENGDGNRKWGDKAVSQGNNL